MFVPVAKQGDSFAKKRVLDYNYERKAVDMKNFVDHNMPSFIEKVSGDLSKFQEKAQRNGLPQVLLFTSKAKTLALTKYLSTEFRRRLLIAEIHPTKPNKVIMDDFGIKDLPALLVIPHAAEGKQEAVRYLGDGFTRNKLHSFLSEHALKKKVFPSKKKMEDDSGASSTGESAGGSARTDL